MDEWLPNFTEEVQRLLGYSPTTARAYASDIRRFLDFLKAQGKPVPPQELTSEDVVGFLQAEARQGRRRATVHRRLASLRVLERCLLMTHRIEQGFIPSEEHFTDVLEQSRPSRPTTCLSTADLQRLWQTLLTSGKRQASRDLAMIALLAEWGFPVNLLLTMEMHQIDLEKKTVWLPHISGTLEKWPLGRSYEPLRRYLSQNRNDFVRRENESHVFLSQQGGALSRQSVWHALRQWGMMAGLETVLTPRLLRTTAAYRMMKEGTPAHTIGAAMGHANPLSTSLLLRRLREACKDLPPAELPSMADDTP